MKIFLICFFTWIFGGIILMLRHAYIAAKHEKKVEEDYIIEHKYTESVLRKMKEKWKNIK